MICVQEAIEEESEENEAEGDDADANAVTADVEAKSGMNFAFVHLVVLNLTCLIKDLEPQLFAI